MPVRPKRRDFTLGDKRKVSRAEIRHRFAPAPELSCERCGESDGLKTVFTTAHGSMLLCFCCRRANAIAQEKKAEMAASLNRTEVL